MLLDTIICLCRHAQVSTLQAQLAEAQHDNAALLARLQDWDVGTSAASAASQQLQQQVCTGAGPTRRPSLPCPTATALPVYKEPDTASNDPAMRARWCVSRRISRRISRPVCFFTHVLTFVYWYVPTVCGVWARQVSALEAELAASKEAATAAAAALEQEKAKVEAIQAQASRRPDRVIGQKTQIGEKGTLFICRYRVHGIPVLATCDYWYGMQVDTTR